MSLIVKGMEMPISCEKCPFNDYEQGYCFAVCEFGNRGWPEFSLIVGDMKTRHPKCPILPLPEKHGRLIDADCLKLVLEKNFGGLGGADVLRQMIDFAPTIVPAEGGSEDGDTA